MYTLRKLTKQEAAQPLAKFLNTPITNAVLFPFASSMPTLEGFYPAQPKDLLNEVDRRKNGWCILDNGVGYITVQQYMPYVTKEMLYWMFAWQGLEPLNYAVLNPQTHHSAAISELDRKKILNPFLDLELKCQGITVFSVENTPLGMQDNLTLYISPEDMGLNFLDADLRQRTFIGGTFIRQLRTEQNPGKKWVGIILHDISSTDQGVYVQTHIWIGCRFLRRQIKRLDNVSIQATPEFTKILAEQTAQEWAHLATILPDIHRFTDGKLEVLR